MTLSFLSITLVLVPGNFRSIYLWRPEVHHRQTAIFMVIAFVTLGILGLLSAVAVPHAFNMAHQSKSAVNETELLKIRAAVEDMLQQSPAGKLISIGPVSDLSLVKTADEPALELTDYLPPEITNPITSGCTYGFTSDGLVVQYQK